MDLVLRNAKVYTVDPARPWAGAVAVRDGRIAWVGDDKDAPEARETIDVEGRLALPGFVDAHNHVRLGSETEAVQLGDAATLIEVRRLLDAYAAAHPDREWIVGEEWSYSAGPEDRSPRAEDLDGVAPGRAIMVFSYDVHNVWLNREAIRRFGLSRGAVDVPFGHAELDAATGEPTGFVHDFAVMGLSRAGHAMLTEQVRPNFAPESQYLRLLSSLDMAIGFGITTVVEPQNSLDDLPLFVRARDEGKLRSRMIAALFHPRGTTVEELDAFAEARRRFDDDRFRVAPVKLYIDDVLEPHTAAMLEPYADMPETRGDTFYSPDEFARVVAELERRGFQTFTHATGDRGIRTALDAIEASRRRNGPGDRRHQLVHVECVHPDDLGRFAELGVVACMQPRHAAPDIVDVWRAAAGPRREHTAFPWRSLQASGATLAFSSDWNVAEMDPLVGMYTALTRADLKGEGAWVEEETLDLASTIRAYTMGSAYANFAEGDRGSISTGKHADLVALSQNLFEIEPAGFLETGADLVMTGGKMHIRRF
ncbi:MAG: amidohydrolase [Actinomycetota bacterium]|nr:amidohydrolase [Actinomycetota bacterium]